MLPSKSMGVSTYHTDYYAWTQEQAATLRSGGVLERENLAEEIESLGIGNRREVVSRLVVILTHLLKWDHQPGERSRSWRNGINEQRRRLDRLLKQSPSLRTFAATEAMEQAYADALEISVEETGIPQRTFRERAPYTFEQVMTKPLEL